MPLSFKRFREFHEFFKIAPHPYSELSIIHFIRYRCLHLAKHIGGFVTNPAFTAVIALLFLKERIHISTLICIALSLIGLALMVNPSLFLEQGEGVALPWFAVSIGLLGAIGSAVAYVLVRRLSQTEDSSVIIFYFPLIALPLSIVLPGESFVMPDLTALLLLILVGVFTQVGQVGLTKAMQTEGAAKATAYSYVQVVFAVILGWMFFAEIPTLWTYVGGGLIVAGALVNTLGRRMWKKG